MKYWLQSRSRKSTVNNNAEKKFYWCKKNDFKKNDLKDDFKKSDI